MTGSGSLLELSDLSEFKFKCVSVWDQSIFMKIQGGIILTPSFSGATCYFQWNNLNAGSEHPGIHQFATCRTIVQNLF